MDREKIIAAMEWCMENPCKGCPYEQNQDAEGRCTISDDTIALLKEQEPIPAIDVAECGWRVDGCRYGKCPKCGKGIMSYHDYCGYCGQAVRWE